MTKSFLLFFILFLVAEIFQLRFGEIGNQIGLLNLAGIA